MKGRLNGPSDPYQNMSSYGDISDEDKSKGLVQIYEVFDRKTGLQYCLADGYKDFLREPMSPDVKVETFWPVFSLVFTRFAGA